MSLYQDLRFGVRMLAKDPGFTAVVVLTLALGIGANTTVFTLANAVLFKGLPFEQPQRIIYLTSNNLSKGRDRTAVSYPDFADLRARTKKFQGLAAFAGFPSVLNDPGGLPERYPATRISANCFSLIGQKPLLGRDFLPEEEKQTAAPVAILGYNVWKSRYGGDESILGRAVRINDVPTLIVGVMPNDMKFPGDADLWMPLVPSGNWEKRDFRGLNMFGRLAAGVTLAEARAEIGVLAKNLEKEYPKSNAGIGALVLPFSDAVNGGPIRTVFLALLGAVGFVLLIACANVANLLLTRSLSRAKEISIRSALGASRLRIVRQLLIESVLMGLLGGILGLPLAMWGVRAFDVATANSGKPSWIKFTMDFTVFHDGFHRVRLSGGDLRADRSSLRARAGAAYFQAGREPDVERGRPRLDGRSAHQVPVRLHGGGGGGSGNRAAGRRRAHDSQLSQNVLARHRRRCRQAGHHADQPPRYEI
jgi:predicted permease